MDFSQIIVGLISAVGAVVVVIIDNRRMRSLIEYRIDKLEEKVDTHNHYAERFAEIEKDIAIIKTRLEE